MQPTQLSLMPDQVSAPPPDLLARLPEAQAAAVALLARLIAQVADPTIATTDSGEASGDE